MLIIQNYPQGGGFAVLPGIFHITRVSNTGAAFGILKHSGLLLVLVSAVSIFFLAGYMFRNILSLAGASKEAFGLYRWNACGWALVIAGALGNLYDRLRFGYVIDFLDFRVWPVFNIADIGICAGVSLVFLGLIKKQGPS